MTSQDLNSNLEVVDEVPSLSASQPDQHRSALYDRDKAPEQQTSQLTDDAPLDIPETIPLMEAENRTSDLSGPSQGAFTIKAGKGRERRFPVDDPEQLCETIKGKP